MNRICPLCDADAFESLWSFEALNSGCCGQCGHVYSVGAPPVTYEDFGQACSAEALLEAGNDLFRLAHDRREAVVRQTGLRNGRVLELGCGYGHFLREMTDNGWEAWGIEPSHAASSFARDRFGLEQVTRSEYGAVNGEHLVGRKGVFDLVAAFHLLEHVADPRALITELRDELRPGGVLALAVPNLFTLHRDFHELHFIARGLHRHSFAPAMLVSLLESSGLTPVYVQDESSSSVSPSSVLVLAVNDHAASAVSAPGYSESPCQAMARFHADLDALCATVGDRLRAWAKAQEKVGIFGAGRHTQAVLELCGLGSQEILCIIDDDSEKWGKNLQGIEIVGPDSVPAAQCTRLVVSSLAAEDRILQRLHDEHPDAQAYGIYRDLAAGLNND